MSSSRDDRTGPTTGGTWDEKTATILLRPPSTGSRYTISALVSPVGGLAWATLSILTINSRLSLPIGSPVNGENSCPAGDLTGRVVVLALCVFPLVSTKKPTIKTVNASAELPPAISARRFTAMVHPLRASKSQARDLRALLGQPPARSFP